MAPINSYIRKVITAEKAAGLAQPGMRIEYGGWALFPVEFDAALAGRIAAGEVRDLALSSISNKYAVQAEAAAQPEDGITMGSWYYSNLDRQQGTGGHPPRPYTTANYHELPGMYAQAQFAHNFPDIFVIQTTPMGADGFFNWGINNSHNIRAAQNAKIVILEVNTTVPRALGGFGEGIHLDDVDYIIEGRNTPIATAPPPADASKEELAITNLIVEEVQNGACLQLGIGALPNAVGKALAQTDLKDLGISTEMFCEAFMPLYQAGKITNRYKTADPYKAGYTFAFGSQALYDFMHDNAFLASLPVDYVNDPSYIRSQPGMVSINNLLEVDLFTQVTSETAGLRQISGPGGQMDYALGSYESEGGKSFLAFTSTHTDKQGNIHSRIKPTLSTGAVITVPRSVTHWLVTEYGKVMVKGMSNWDRAEALISIAHPAFRDELIQAAGKMGIWRRSNKR